MEWAETRSLLQELEQLFQRDNDVNDILDIAKMAKEIEIHRDSNLMSAKSLIKELTISVASRESDVLAPSETAHSKQLEQIMHEKENVSKQYESLREVVDSKRERVKELARRRIETTTMPPPPQVAVDPTAESKAAYTLSLYAKISNISWNLSDSNEVISGYIANEETKEFKSFEIPTSLSKFEIANSLWDMISENSN